KPNITAIANPAPQEKKMPKAPADIIRIGIGILDNPNINSFTRTYSAVLLDINTLLIKVVIAHIPVNPINEILCARFWFKNRRSGAKYLKAIKYIKDINIDVMSVKVKQELIIVSFFDELGKNLIKDILNPSKEK